MFRNGFIKIGMLLIVLGLLVFSVENVSVSILRYQQDVEESKEISKEISRSYFTFQDIVKKCKDNMISVSHLLDVYYCDFPSQNPLILEKILEIKDDINHNFSLVHRLYQSCQSGLNDTVVESQCENFSINYSAMIDGYEDIITQYNLVLSSYNQYAISKGQETILSYPLVLDEEIYQVYRSMEL